MPFVYFALLGFQNFLFREQSFGTPFLEESNWCLLSTSDLCSGLYDSELAADLLYFNDRAFENLGSLFENTALPMSFYSGYISEWFRERSVEMKYSFEYEKKNPLFFSESYCTEYAYYSLCTDDFGFISCVQNSLLAFYRTSRKRAWRAFETRLAR